MVSGEEVMTVEMKPELVGDALTRLRRAHGQLGGVIAMIESGEDCVAVLTQLAAVSPRARPGRVRLVASGLRHCQTMRERGEEPPMSEEEWEKLFLYWPDPERPLARAMLRLSPLFVPVVYPRC